MAIAEDVSSAGCHKNLISVRYVSATFYLVHYVYGAPTCVGQLGNREGIGLFTMMAHTVGKGDALVIRSYHGVQSAGYISL